MNFFIDGDVRITGIDVDKFAGREPEFDVAWFLMQSAAFGFFAQGTFDATSDMRKRFCERYEQSRGYSLKPERLGIYMARAFLKNLHFELVLLNTGQNRYAEPWLMGAEDAIEGRGWVSLRALGHVPVRYGDRPGMSPRGDTRRRP
jgi:hypothetical protein